MKDLHTQLKEMIVRVLMLEGVTPADIGTEDRLFGAAPDRKGLGLDSVDALELAIHIEEEFGVKMPDDARAREAFASVASLATYIEANR
ncbi:MAG: phosphopantetheine-binding protein [Myxococcota bacterium]